MTFTKISALLLLLLILAPVSAQEQLATNTEPADSGAAGELQAPADDLDEVSVADQVENQLDADGEAIEVLLVNPELPEATPDDESTLRVFDLSLEQPAAVEAPEEITLDLFESRSSYRIYMDAKQYPQAVEVGDHALALAEEEYGRDSIELVPILNELGLALLFNRQPEIAVQHFDRGVTIIETTNGIFSADLVDPLTGMGLAMQQMENHTGAINLFLRGQHVIHRDRGVTDLSQTNIMSMLTQSLLAEERLTDAENVQEAILKINEMNYGAGSGEMAEPMMALANWQRRYGLLNNSRVLYRSSIDLRLNYLDPSDSDMKPMLEKLGLRYFDVMAPSWMQGYRFSDDVIDALTIHRGALNTEDHILSYMAAGDQLILFGDTKQAHQAYSKAWKLAAKDSNSSAYIDNYFSARTILNDGAGMDFAKLQSIPMDELAFAEFTFTLESSGQPRDIKIIDSNLDKKLWKQAARNFRSARFRPKIDGGVAKNSGTMQWRRVFPRGRQINPARAQDAYAWLLTHSTYSHLTR